MLDFLSCVLVVCVFSLSFLLSCFLYFCTGCELRCYYTLIVHLFRNKYIVQQLELFLNQ